MQLLGHWTGSGVMATIVAVVTVVAFAGCWAGGERLAPSTGMKEVASA